MYTTSTVYLVYPEFSDDNVVDRGHHLVPSVVISAAMEHNVSVPDRVADQVLAPELGGDRVLLPHREVLVLNVHGKHRWVVRYLYTVEAGAGKRREEHGGAGKSREEKGGTWGSRQEQGREGRNMGEQARAGWSRGKVLNPS